MFNMYLSGSSLCPHRNQTNVPSFLSFLEIGLRVRRAASAAQSVREPFFPSEARLLFCRKSEILFPGRVSCSAQTEPHWTPAAPGWALGSFGRFRARV